MTFLFNKRLQLELFDNSSKTCYSCKQTKAKVDFHKHNLMRDGYLNLCKSCSYENKKIIRLENPEARKLEHIRLRERMGFMTRQEYFAKRLLTAKGRKASSNQYAHKRRLKTKNFEFTELDQFVFDEASKLKELRKTATGIDWHIDHIVPLNHKNACGLHNAYNFQVVPAKWNLTKRHTNMNKYFGGEI
jgi:hypothetical protein